MSGSLAADAAASEASVRKLMEVTKARQLMDGAMAQLDAVMQGSVKQATGSAALTAKQQTVLDEMRRKVVETKAGRAVITKMPVIMQYSLQLVQERMGAMAPGLQQIQRESLEQMKACCSHDD
ncbi:MAG: hypothetical protein R3E69_02460 [Steroidobacteraceae bacterium]